MIKWTHGKPRGLQVKNKIHSFNTYLFLDSNRTHLHIKNQRDFAGMILKDSNKKPIEVTSFFISIEGLIDKCQAGDCILVVDASAIKKTYEDLREIGNLCLRNKISIEILNPLTHFDLGFNNSYAIVEADLLPGIAAGEFIPKNKVLYYGK
jgi:hypothetical protein